jgi:hypothetical protein
MMQNIVGKGILSLFRSRYGALIQLVRLLTHWDTQIIVIQISPPQKELDKALSVLKPEVSSTISGSY